MFDLFRSRAKAVRYLLGGLLMLVAISMVVTLIPGYGTGGDTSDQVVAEIGKEVVTVREVQTQLNKTVRNRNFPRELMSVYVPQIVDQVITYRILAYQAARMGFQVTEADVARAIRAEVPQLYQDGKFVGREIYARLLASIDPNLTIEEFETTRRQQMLLDKLRGLVSDGVTVTPAEIEKEYRRRNEKVKLEYIPLPPAKFRSQITLSAEEIRTYFEKNRATFQTPEKRGLAFLVADETRLAQAVSLPEDELLRTYRRRQEEYRVPERVKVRHILLKTTDKPAADIPKIQARAEELLKQVRGGADFAELARKNSEDTGTAPKGGDLDWVARGQTVKAFEEAAFSLMPKQFSNVIKTEYGFHILQVLEKEEARLKPFEEVKAQMATELKLQLTRDTTQRLADQAQAELVKSPLQAPQIAARLGLQLIKVDQRGPGEPIPEIGSSPELENALSGLQKGQVTPVFQIPGNKLVVAVLTDIFPPRLSEFAEVEGQIKERLLGEKAAALASQRAQQAAEKAKALNGDLKQVAQALGLEVKTTQDFGLDGAADGIGPAQEVYQSFTQPVGAIFGPVAVGDQRFLCKVASKTPADMSKLAEQRAAILQSIKSRKAQQRTELFEDSLRASLIQQGKVKIHRDVVNRLVSSYRG